jgi:CheY-like chemotaxis protein
VLIAEDAPELQALEQLMLERMGLTVTVVSNGLQAIEAAQNYHFDLILMDMRMPAMGGIEATRELRRLGNRTPISGRG